MMVTNGSWLFGSRSLWVFWPWVPIRIVIWVCALAMIGFYSSRITIWDPGGIHFCKAIPDNSIYRSQDHDNSSSSVVGHYLWDAAKKFLVPVRTYLIVADRKVGMAEEKRSVVSTLYGGSGGGHWEDGLYHDVTQITLRSGTCIDSFGVVYRINGENVKAESHGGNGGDTITITLDSKSNEVLKTVSGSVGEAYWTADKQLVIRSLKFVTNIKTYGPFGIAPADGHFTFTVKDGEKIIGFFGRSGGVFLDAIGFHVTHP